MPTPLDSDVFLFADGGSGHVCDLGSAPETGQWDVLCVNSNTTVSTPSGFTAAESAVTNQGAYIFVREAAGSEGSTVTVTTNGAHNTQVGWSRWPASLIAVDTSTNTQANAASGNNTPTHSTGTLAESTELVIAFGALHSIGLGGQTSPTWSSGYTELTSSAVQGTTTTGVRGYVGYRENAGTAAEAPQVSWSGDGAQNRYMLAVSFTVSGATDTAAELAGTGPGGTSALTGTVDVAGEVAGAGPGGVATMTGTVTAGAGGTATGTGWSGLGAIYRRDREQRAVDEAGPPDNCPNDGSALAMKGGTYWCPFDGWTWDGGPVTW